MLPDYFVVLVDNFPSDHPFLTDSSDLGDVLIIKQEMCASQNMPIYINYQTV
jgi:hypothetical protein